MADLLDLAQLELNTFKLNKEFFSLFDAIEQVFSVLGHIAALKRVTLEVPQLSEEDQENFENIYGDKKRIVQIILNFLSKALKYSKADTTIKLLLVLREVQEINNNDFVSNNAELEKLVFNSYNKNMHARRINSSYFPPSNKPKVKYLNFDIAIND